MTLTATPVSAATTAPRRRQATPEPVLGGDAWIVPFERGGHPWLTASAPQITVSDRRATLPGNRTS